MAQTGKGDDGDVIGEYCAEMTGHPIFMIRRGDYKCCSLYDDDRNYQS